VFIYHKLLTKLRDINQCIIIEDGPLFDDDDDDDDDDVGEEEEEDGEKKSAG
jgi:hypothetical protein